MIHILWRGPTREIYHEPALGKNPRWCFLCRKLTSFSFIVLADEDPESYYEPTPHIRCDECKKDDADCFPGWTREWGEDGWYRAPAF